MYSVYFLDPSNEMWFGDSLVSHKKFCYSWKLHNISVLEYAAFK